VSLALRIKSGISTEQDKTSYRIFGSEMLIKKLPAGAIYIVATGGNDVASSIPRRNSSSDGLITSLIWSFQHYDHSLQ